jgi:hypothetical protein
MYHIQLRLPSPNFWEAFVYTLSRSQNTIVYTYSRVQITWPTQNFGRLEAALFNTTFTTVSSKET